MNPTAIDLEFKCKQLKTQLEYLRNLEWKPSHRSSSQQHVKLVEVILALVIVQQT